MNGTVVRRRADYPRRRTCWVIGVFVFLSGNPAFGQIDSGFELVPREVVEARLRQVTRDNSKRQAILRAMFEDAGCTDDSLTEQVYRRNKPPNVLCTLPGTRDTVIVVAAHFDHSTAYGEGAVDDWSGASLLPTLFQSLSARPRRHTFKFVGFGGEETRLAGSQFFVSHLSESKAKAIRAMVNLECLGVGPTKVLLRHADGVLLQRILYVADALKMSLGGFNPGGASRDDADSFVKRGIPTLTIHSLTQETIPILRSTRDNLKAIKLDDYYASYHLVAAYLALLDRTLK